MREWRSFNPMNAEQKKRENCRSYANVYQRRGLLIPKPCEICGAKETEKHHPDYSKPLSVIWYCRPCHLKKHLRKRRGTE